MDTNFRTGDLIEIKTGSFPPRSVLTVAYDTGDRIVFAGYPVTSISDRALIVASERMCDEEFIRLYDEIVDEGGILSHGVKRCHSAEAERVRIALTGFRLAGVNVPGETKIENAVHHLNRAVAGLPVYVCSDGPAIVFSQRASESRLVFSPDSTTGTGYEHIRTFFCGLLVGMGRDILNFDVERAVEELGVA
ncbi:hypothetical protein [Devosia sp. SD17-2]|jgi:hypothetical protein|uniref:hypothetical protein n=1 Tax=Devosia sp. SD17-2 TaxID=2976459 RepID=UPI0023D83441|nr:hypothetical protein [Devosia sp. SD17-2]WEJ32744.1 hypothetical protein NYQ88_17965 [Devosia sp. SD17-2]